MEGGGGGDWEGEGGIVNQVKLGEKAGIDTAEVQSWDMREVAELQSTHVDFKNGITVILRGDAKAAFDKWAATLPRAGGDGIDMEQIIGRIIARDREDPFPTENEWREWLRECLRGKTDPKPLCETCACYEAESGHCAEFAGNHYPECWVEREEEAEIECASCRHYTGPPSYYCVPGRGHECPGCYEEGNRKALRAARKAAEAEAKEEPPQKAKVLLLSHIWECSKCGEVLATDWRGDAFHLEGPPWSEITIEGNVKIRLDDVPLVMCSGCGTANLWPDELRERVAKGTAGEDVDDRTG